MLTKDQFFQKYGPFAQRASVGTGISPVLILAQAYVESGGAKSQLAATYNNFFGVKADASWKGKFVTLRTREQTKDGKNYFINAKFRAYDSPEQSFKDHIAFLKQNPRYAKAGLFDKPNDYAHQADSLQKAGYATDINYAKIIKSVGNSFASIITKNPTTTIIAILVIGSLLLAV